MTINVSFMGGTIEDNGNLIRRLSADDILLPKDSVIYSNSIVDPNSLIAIYSVDLTSLDKIDYKKMVEELSSFKKTPGSSIILLGTNADELVSDVVDYHQLDGIEKKCQTITFDHKAAITPKNLCALKVALAAECRKRMPAEEPTPKPKPVAHAALKVPDPFAEAKRHLDRGLNGLTSFQRYQINQKVNDLEKSMRKVNPDVTTIVNTFTNECDAILKNKHPHAKRAVYSFAASVVVIALVGLLCFGIGFVAGAWSGPGAFITGLLAGKVGACAAAAVTGVVGIRAGCKAFNFFSTPQDARGATDNEQAARKSVINFAESIKKIGA